MHLSKHDLMYFVIFVDCTAASCTNKSGIHFILSGKVTVTMVTRDPSQRYDVVHHKVICSQWCIGGRRSLAVACWASDHWVASSNPLRGKFRH